MSYRFVNKPLEHGFYEPEGIYLDVPFQESAMFVQGWGADAELYAQYRYNGISLKGYIGAGFDVTPNTTIFSMDGGRVSEINIEPGGFERYIKIEHRWGESVYARVNDIQVESGQLIKRGMSIATSGRVRSTAENRQQFSRRFHVGIRIRPFNRFDGWGGFSDPLPYLNPEGMNNYFVIPSKREKELYPPLPMVQENENMRRP